MKANFRQIFVYNLDIESGKRGAVLPSMEDLIAILNRRRLDGLAHLSISNGEIDLALGDITIDDRNHQATVLIRHSDKNAAESAYSNILGNTFTAHRKNQQEGGETGVHLFISLAVERTMPNRHTCIIEKVPNIDVALIRRFLNRLIHDEYDTVPDSFTYPNPAGQRTRVGDIALDRCLPRLEFEGRPSQTLADDVEQGRLTGITLSRAVAQTPVGGVAFLRKREASLILDIDQNSLTGNIWGDVRRALRSESQEYDTAQIKLTLPGRAKSVSVKVSTATAAPLAELYIKSFDIWNIMPPMAQSSETVVPQFEARVAGVVRSERDI